MDEKTSESKLKRKKCATEGPRTDIFHRSTLLKNKECSSVSTEKCKSTNGPADVWWSKQDLCAVERLWALTLQSALPCPEVPDLPLASSLRSAVHKQSELRWCSLGEEVTPLPRPPRSSSPPAVSHSLTTESHLNPSPAGEQALPPQTSIPGPLRSSPIQEGQGEGTGSDANWPSAQGLVSGHNHGGRWTGGDRDRHMSFRQETGGDIGPNRGPNGPLLAARPGEKESHPSVRWTKRGSCSSLPGPRSSGRGGKGGGGEEGKEKRKNEAGSVIKRQLPAHQGGTSDSFVGGGERWREQQEEEEEGRVSGRGRADGDVGRGEGGGGGVKEGGGLQSCPMCLLVFHSGFTQMECDSHLAQCLSEMNVDMTW